MSAAPEGRSLRQRQGEQVRASVLEAAVAALEDKPVDDLAMADVAERAGISLRTLYRYFPDRSALLHAAGEHLYGSLGVPFDIAGPDEISSSFLDAARRLSTRPNLTRALVQTTAGRVARSTARAHRVHAIRVALKPLTDHLDAHTARAASAVIAHLCSAASWVAISDESDLDDTEAQQAVAWAIDTLIQALRPPRKPSRARSPRP
jgi:AcrR family transcriptional regulator